MSRLDGLNLDPETGVIVLVLGVGVNLALDPHDGVLVLLDIIGIRVVQPGGSVAVTGEPLVPAIVPLAVPARGDIGVDIPTRLRLVKPPNKAHCCCVGETLSTYFNLLPLFHWLSL